MTEKERFLRAKKVSHEGYEGPLYCPELGGDNQGYFACLADLHARFAAANVDAPPYAWACETITFRLDAQQVVGRALEAHHEGATGGLSPDAISRLQQTLDEWCAELPVIVTYEPDYSRAVLLGDLKARAPAA
ncbi:hypothetical protein LVJ94_34540 [Pendulispora rubella]|uniref:Barstar (barnase inhibitor) domain-containing protein n=1 Tax=Pendulispora rubella TaxID=2741070 RepID=A0ABZ2KTM0_9BACT